MQKSTSIATSFPVKSYVSLTKPGIIMGNLITGAAGFAIARPQNGSLGLLFVMIIGLSFVIASACTFNNFIDRRLDSVMLRTQKRPLVMGTLVPKEALIFGSLLLLVGFCSLYFISPLAAFCSLMGFSVYVFCYSFSKYSTSWATLIGSVAGATPPLVGYSAATQTLSFQALIVFLLVVLWQMPHFYAIGIYRIDDYARGEIPILPLSKGIKRTKISMLYFVALYGGVLSFYTFQYLNMPSIILLHVQVLGWLYLAFKGFSAANDVKWAKKMFIYSLMIIMSQSFCQAITL